MDIIPDYQNERNKTGAQQQNALFDFISKMQQTRALEDTKAAYTQGLLQRAMLQQGYAPSQMMQQQAGYSLNVLPPNAGITMPSPVAGQQNPQFVNPAQAYQQFQQNAQPQLNPYSPVAQKNSFHQDQLENQAMQRMRMAIAGRQTNASLQQAKLNSTVHALSLMDQAFDPSTGEINLNPQQQSELALNIANTISGTTQTADNLRKDLEAKSLYGDLNGTLQYLSGKPKNSTTKDLYKWYMDTLVRQGKVSQDLRDKNFDDVKQLIPTGLEQSRADKILKMHFGTNINDYLQASPAYQKFFGNQDSTKTIAGVTYKKGANGKWLPQQ